MVRYNDNTTNDDAFFERLLLSQYNIEGIHLPLINQVKNNLNPEIYRLDYLVGTVSFI